MHVYLCVSPVEHSGTSHLLCELRVRQDGPIGDDEIYQWLLAMMTGLPSWPGAICLWLPGVRKSSVGCTALALSLCDFLETCGWTLCSTECWARWSSGLIRQGFVSGTWIQRPWLC